jgi:hypothetical protein
MYHDTPGPRTMRITVEDSALSRCGAWAALISTVATVAALVVNIAFH